MSDDDIFGDSDRTVIKPMPGGPRPSTPTPPPAQQPPPVAQQPHVQAPVQAQQPPVSAARPADPAAYAPELSAVTGSRFNPIVNAATSLFFLVGQLKSTMSVNNVDQLRNSVVQQIQSFEAAATQSNIKPEQVLTAKYAMCCLVDEVVLNTPWGGDSVWAAQSMLNTFHREAWGGEKFFQILERLLQEPASNADNLAFYYLCLAMGFKGKYQMSDRGGSDLAGLKDNLFRTIRNLSGEHERDLSPRWQSDAPRANALVRYIPLWVVGAVGAALLVILYLGFKLLIENSASDLHESLDEIGSVQIESTRSN